MKNNKGFSLVELIIVIAIMAILAGALAPALIKYINKSRRSTDIANADTIRTACQTAMQDEDAMEVISKKGSLDKKSITSLKSEYGAYSTELSEILGNAKLTSKYFAKGSEFTVSIDVSKNSVIVYAGDDQVSPVADAGKDAGKGAGK